MDNYYDFNHQVVDVIHTYVQGLLLSGNDQICYPLTKTEKENNDFVVTFPSDKKKGPLIVVITRLDNLMKTI